jgi:hypothetical protein
VKNAKIIVPLLNHKVSTFKGPTWFISENIFYDNITDEDFGVFHRDLEDEYKNLINIKTRCIYITEPNIRDIDNDIKDLATLLKYVLNTFALNHPIIISFAVLLETKRKTKIIRCVDLESDVNFQKLKSLNFKLRVNTSREEIKVLFDNLKKTCAKNPSLFLTIDRFNRSVTRSEIIDKIIDLTICLESLFQAQNEIKFKFALYNAIISSKDSIEAESNFNLLCALYDVRSVIVHGSSRSKNTAKKISHISQDIERVFKICTSAINYKLLYESEKRELDWQSHLKRIVLNPNEKIIK